MQLIRRPDSHARKLAEERLIKLEAGECHNCPIVDTTRLRSPRFYKGCRGQRCIFNTYRTVILSKMSNIAFITFLDASILFLVMADVIQ